MPSIESGVNQDGGGQCLDVEEEVRRVTMKWLYVHKKSGIDSVPQPSRVGKA